jgi:hypothetical protein
MSKTEFGAVVSYIGIVICFFWNVCSFGASAFQNKPFNWLGLFLLFGFVLSYLFFATAVVQTLIEKKNASKNIRVRDGQNVSGNRS